MMKQSGGDLSIIIVNWKSLDYLQACLRSLYREVLGISFEVIVVDNASHDGCKMVLSDTFPSVYVVESETNVGFACANNIGFRKSSGGAILFLNPDTEVIDNSIGKMVGLLRSRAELGALGPRLLNTDRTVQSSCVQAFPTILNQVLDFDFLRRWCPRLKLWGTRPLLDGCPAEAEAISGACFLVKREAFEKVGCFSEQYFMYSDDLDLSYRLKTCGYSVLCLRDCTVIHHGGKSSARQSSYFADVLQRDSLVKFFEQTKGRRYAVAYRFSMFAVATARLIAIASLLPFRALAFRDASLLWSFRKWIAILAWSITGNSSQSASARAVVLS